MSTPCWQRIELTSKFFGQTKMADFERKSAIDVHRTSLMSPKVSGASTK